MAPRKKARSSYPDMEPGMEKATRRARKPAPSAKKPTPSARPRSAEAKAARMATSRGSSEAQSAAGRGRSRSAETTAARRSVARRTAAGSEAARAAMGTGRNRAAEAQAAMGTGRNRAAEAQAAATPTPQVLIRPKNEPYGTDHLMETGIPTRRTPTAFTPFDELGNQIPARQRKSFTPRDVLAGPEFTPAQIEAHSQRVWKAKMKKRGINV